MRIVAISDLMTFVDQIPEDVRSYIKNFTADGNYPISEDTVVKNNIVKAESIIFNPGRTLSFTGVPGIDGHPPWMAIVARKMLFEDPTILSVIRWAPDWEPEVPPKPATPAKPGQPGKAPETAQGAAGSSGINGTPGAVGVKAPHGPTLYIIVEDIAYQRTGLPVDQTFELLIDVRGMRGGDGGPGGNAGPGGDGGGGGDADWFEGSLFEPPNCKGGAGVGGKGGKGGNGARGGDGGPGGNSCPIMLIGPNSAQKALAFADVFRRPGRGGAPGKSGYNGAPGDGGSRGERPGACGGGHNGAVGDKNNFVPEAANPGKDGTQSPVAKLVVPNINEFF